MKSLYSFVRKIRTQIYAPVKKKPLDGLRNSGDLFGWFLGHKILDDNFYPTIKTRRVHGVRKFAFVGSCLQGLEKNSKMTIYGPGFIRDKSDSSNLLGNYVIGVRGHLSRDMFKRGDQPQVVSDPGLLAHRLFNSELSEDPERKKQEIGFVIHSVDRELFCRKAPGLSDFIVENYMFDHLSIPQYFEELKKFKRIATTSLHGAVFCHSLGIPCAVFSISGFVQGGDFKYKDYFSSLGVDFNMTHMCEIGVRKEDFISFVDSMWQPSRESITSITDKQLEDVTGLLRS